MLWVLLEFLAIVYVLGKDITQVPRYNFIYYPAMCALLGAVLTTDGETAATGGQFVGTRATFLHQSSRSSLLALLMVGLLSCGFVVNDRVFLKPYQPQQVAENMGRDGLSLVVMSYEDYQDIALGLSFALALSPSEQTRFAFVSRSQGYETLWQKLAMLQLGATPPIQTLWTIAPGLRKKDFPAQLVIGQATCKLDTTRHYRIGIPYQGYQC
ncbi:MAG: hypothetical protein HC936_11420 [Leptolyngbyaceae cyanobacterium SU_3_3]|nr:hypothetical protein [Leptolyngbyaceae cyanobacterium SU_3_3]